jgi:hypothetical protein
VLRIYGLSLVRSQEQLSVVFEANQESQAALMFPQFENHDTVFDDEIVIPERFRSQLMALAAMNVAQPCMLSTQSMFDDECMLDFAAPDESQLAYELVIDVLISLCFAVSLSCIVCSQVSDEELADTPLASPHGPTRSTSHTSMRTDMSLDSGASTLYSVPSTNAAPEPVVNSQSLSNVATQSSNDASNISFRSPDASFQPPSSAEVSQSPFLSVDTPALEQRHLVAPPPSAASPAWPMNMENQLLHSPSFILSSTSQQSRSQTVHVTSAGTPQLAQLNAVASQESTILSSEVPPTSSRSASSVPDSQPDVEPMCSQSAASMHESMSPLRSNAPITQQIFGGSNSTHSSLEAAPVGALQDSFVVYQTSLECLPVQAQRSTRAERDPSEPDLKIPRTADSESTRLAPVAQNESPVNVRARSYMSAADVALFCRFGEAEF